MAARHSVAVNGVDDLAVTLLDVLSGLDEICICTGYRLAGKELDWFCADGLTLGQVEPVYETLPGWSEDITSAASFASLPENARNYLKRMEELSGVPIGLISVGPDREQTFTRG